MTLDMAAPLLSGKERIRREILADVLKRHFISKEEFFGRSQRRELCEARQDAAKRLRAANFSNRRIGQILKRDRSTIVYYFNPEMVERKRVRRRIYQVLESLEPEVRQVVGKMAEAEHVSPMLLLREWINERARFELEARARAA